VLQVDFWAKVKVGTVLAAAVALAVVGMRWALVRQPVQQPQASPAIRASVGPPSERLTLQGIKGKQYLAFTPDSKRLLWANGDGLVKVWDPTTGKELAAFKGRGNSGSRPAVFLMTGRRRSSSSS
jgi:hypothetical protein